MSSARPSGIGLAFMKRRLCLFGDFERHTLSDSSLTVSRYETTGSEIFSGTQAWSSSRSLRQISRCSSPAPATMCSPDSSIEHYTSHVTMLTVISILIPSTLQIAVWGRGTPLPLVHLLPNLFPLLLFPFFHWLYLFSSFVHPFPF